MNTSNLVNLKVGSWNCRGINNKYHELDLFLKQSELDIILLTETKMTPNINFYMSSYKLYRCDHPSGSRQGGSAVLIKNSIVHHELPPIQNIEAQVARVSLKINGVSYQIGSFYSAPQYHLPMSTIWSIVHAMGPKFVLGGDFNSKHPRWASSTINPRGRTLHDALYQFNLQVAYPSEPTHYPDNSNHAPDILDIFVGRDFAHLISPVQVLHELSSDHYPIVATVNGVSTSQCAVDRYPIEWGKYSQLLNDLTSTQLPLKTPRDIEAAVSYLTNIIHFAANEAKPSQNDHLTVNRHFPYTSPHIQHLKNVKKNARRLWESTKYPPHKTNYNRASLELKKALQEKKAQEKRSELQQLDASDGTLWRKTRALTKTPNQIPPLKYQTRWYSSPEEKATLFADLLVEQFSPNPSSTPDFHSQIVADIDEPLQLSIFKTFFTPAQVRNAIERSPTKKAPGFDKITQKHLKHLPRKTLVLLTQIFNAILRTTHFPSKWKHAKVTMIPKPQKQAKDPKGYRPISLLSIFSKLFERLLLPKLLEFLGPIIPPFQFGFRNHHSCPQQVYNVVDEILEAFENQEVCMGLFLDTEKAFDKVWHPGLLHKLKSHLPDTYFRIIRSYLNNRTFSVKYDYAQSTQRNIISGVPQGSVLGPLLFLIYTSDIPVNTYNTTAMFADDIAIVSRSANGMRVSSNIQQHLNEIAKWNKNWLMTLNAQKSKITVHTYKRNFSTMPINLAQAPIPVTESVRYLGIHLNSRLTFKTHIDELVKRLRHRINQLKPLLGRLSPLSTEIKRLIYLSLVRPIWQYGSSLWGSACASQIQRIQTQQNRVLRLITNAPWFVRNTVLHRDLDIQEVKQVIQNSYTQLHSSLNSHPNPVTQDLARRLSTRPVERRLKRKRPIDLL